MNKVAIITGITGQDSSCELLDSKEYIMGGIVEEIQILIQRINHLYKYESDKLILKYGDLTDHCCIINLLNEIYVKHKEIEVLEIYNFRRYESRSYFL